MTDAGVGTTLRAAVGALAAAVLLVACGPGGPGERGGEDARTPPAEEPVQQPPLAAVPEVGPSPSVDPDPDPEPREPAEKPFTPKGCPSIFAEPLQTFEVTMEPHLWAEMQSEFQNVEALRAAGQPVELYRPVTEFRHDDRRTTIASIRLRGNPTYWPSQQKMQFQISFKEQNEDGRFRGLRKIVLDSAHYNASYLRDRLAMGILRDAGVPAPCVNHAELYVNGEYYGLYAHIEKVDREFLERHFEEPGENLYKRGEILKTNEDENPDQRRKDAFWDVKTIQDLEAIADVDQMVRAWAAEAVFPDADGYWAGGWNFYLYDDPERGFVYIPWDIDLAFDNLPADTDPLTWHKSSERFNGRPHIELALKDPHWRARFIEEVAQVRKYADPDVLQARIDAWSSSFEDAAKDDAWAPWTFSYHQWAVQRLRGFVKDRADFLDGWIACHRDGQCGQ